MTGTALPVHSTWQMMRSSADEEAPLGDVGLGRRGHEANRASADRELVGSDALPTV